MERRNFLTALTGAGTVSLAGCSGLIGEDGTEEELQDRGPAGTVEQYVRQFIAMQTGTHTLHHSLLASTREFELTQLETTVAQRNPETEKLAAVAGVEQDQLAGLVSDEETAIVELSVKANSDDGTEEITVEFPVATEDGVWKVLRVYLESTTTTETSSSSGSGSDGESVEQVTDNINVITQVGIVGTNNTIREIRLGVKPAAGSSEINLSELTIQYVSDDSFANLIVGNEQGTGEPATGDAAPESIVVGDRESGDERYTVDVVTAKSEDNILMTDSSDRYEIVIPLAPPADPNMSEGDSNGDLQPLPEGSSVETTITTEVGAQTVAFMQVPDSLAGETPGTSINL